MCVGSGPDARTWLTARVRREGARHEVALADLTFAADRELKDRAERAARARLAQVDIDDVANAGTAVLLGLGQEDLAGRAGRTRYGYVEPTEAAWSLLEEAVEPWLEDITRRGSPGLLEVARGLGLGLLRALRSAERHIRDDDLLVSWAPDFPDDTADRVVELL